MNSQQHNTVRVPASSFGAHLECFGDCLGCSNESLPEYARLRIPAVNPLHRFAPEHFRTLSLWWKLSRKEPLFISGPSGSGKTSTAMQFCARLGTPVVSVTARARMDRRELIGHWLVRNGETVWQDGPALSAWRHGWVLIINEFSTAPADMWVSCNDILEGLPLENEATGEIVPPHPDTRVIVTDNTRGHSVEIEEGFFGRQVQDRSVIDRFWHLRMEAHSEEFETSLLLDGIREPFRGLFKEEALLTLCRGLAKAGADSRSAAKRRTIGFTCASVPISIRSLSRLRDLILCAASETWGESGDDLLRELIRTSFTEALDLAARETAETLLLASLGNITAKLRRNAIRAAR